PQMRHRKQVSLVLRNLVVVVGLVACCTVNTAAAADKKSKSVPEQKDEGNKSVVTLVCKIQGVQGGQQNIVPTTYTYKICDSCKAEVDSDIVWRISEGTCEFHGANPANLHMDVVINRMDGSLTYSAGNSTLGFATWLGQCT